MKIKFAAKVKCENDGDRFPASLQNRAARIGLFFIDARLSFNREDFHAELFATSWLFSVQFYERGHSCTAARTPRGDAMQ